METDLTVGKPETVLWKFCMPLFGSIIFQQLYNIADSLVAGRFIGEQALAAVGNSYEITLIFKTVGLVPAVHGIPHPTDCGLPSEYLWIRYRNHMNYRPFTKILWFFPPIFL